MFSWFKKRSKKASSEEEAPSEERVNPLNASAVESVEAVDGQQASDAKSVEEVDEEHAPTTEPRQTLPLAPPPVLPGAMVSLPYDVAVQFALSPSNLAILGHAGEAKEEAPGLPPLDDEALLTGVFVHNHGDGHQQLTLMLSADDEVRVTTHSAYGRLWREVTLKGIQAAGMLSSLGLGAVTVSELIKTLKDWGVDLRGHPIDRYVLAATVAALVHTPRVMGQPLLEAQHKLEHAISFFSQDGTESRRWRFQQLCRCTSLFNLLAVLVALVASFGAFSTANDSWVEMDEFSDFRPHEDSSAHHLRHDETSYYGAAFVIGAAKFFLMLLAYSALAEHLHRFNQVKSRRKVECDLKAVVSGFLGLVGFVGILGEAAFVFLSARDTSAEFVGRRDNPQFFESNMVGVFIAVMFAVAEAVEFFEQCQMRYTRGMFRFLCGQKKTCRRLAFHGPNWAVVGMTGFVMSYGATHTVLQKLRSDQPRFLSYIAACFGFCGGVRSLFGAVHHTYKTYHDDETDGTLSAKRQVQQRINRHYLERQRWRDADRSTVDNVVNLGFVVGSVLPSLTMMLVLEVPASLFRSLSIATATAGFNTATIWMDDSWHRTPGIPGARMHALQYPLVSEGMVRRYSRCPTGCAMQRKNPWNKVFNALVLFVLQWGVCFGVMQAVPDDVGVVSRRNLATIISTLLAPIVIRTCFFAWLVHWHRAAMEATRFRMQAPSHEGDEGRPADVSGSFHDAEDADAKQAATPQPAPETVGAGRTAMQRRSLVRMRADAKPVASSQPARPAPETAASTRPSTQRRSLVLTGADAKQAADATPQPPRPPAAASSRRSPVQGRPSVPGDARSSLHRSA